MKRPAVAFSLTVLAVSMLFNVPLAAGNASASKFLFWPGAHPAKIARRFDPPTQKWLAGHRGIDLRTAPGSPVYAATAGTILYAGDLAGRPVISLTDTAGRRYTYEPVTPSVSVGEAVTRGQAIGVALVGHCPGGDCLHFGVKNGRDDYLDPLRLLGGTIRLYPA